MSEIILSLVSTIIPVHNRPELLRDAVASVLAQTYRPVEIIIVDDGSTDDTPEVISRLLEEYPGEIFSVKIPNSGPGIAREAGRQVARGEFIQYLDSDDILLPAKFELQVAGLREQPECGVSYGKTRYYHINEKPTETPLKRTGEKIEKMFPAFLESRWWSTNTPLFRREVTNKAGPWTTLRNEEDWEYDCRVASLGIKLHFCDQFVSETRNHDNGRLCINGSIDPAKLADRATAHGLIFQHAQRAGITHDEPEMEHFSRELFLLCRQCGAAGLAYEAKQLFDLSIEATLPERRKSAKFWLYSLGASIVGWVNMGKISKKLDNFRN